MIVVAMMHVYPAVYVDCARYIGTPTAEPSLGCPTGLLLIPRASALCSAGVVLGRFIDRVGPRWIALAAVARRGP
ncbi:hypothetical protein B4915_02970 [Leucobacter massiliensis]|uniref:Uncharacterized protein n=1 Tax=Leucobacter massiliensis TaxID=1686285 RepID=A0A2S9QR24_9MICO|nr:hypothetical protein B4915_02970 [Leucobacter massiliensis]